MHFVTILPCYESLPKVIRITNDGRKAVAQKAEKM